MNIKITAKDFFLHLGAIVTFYASVIALITLLFEVINAAYPKVMDAYQYYGSPSISFQVATLIVAFPLFLFLSWLMQKSYVAEPSLRTAPIRIWLSYITLFVAGAVVVGDLVTVIYMFLDGQELTAGFLLKVLALLLIAGGVFLYYLREIRNLIGLGERNIWRAVSTLIIVGSVILGFLVVGSPASQRQARYDNQRLSDLQSIQWQLVNYYQQKGTLPGTLDKLKDPLSGFVIPTDPETKISYEYEMSGNLSFNLCATFNRPNQAGGSTLQPMYYPEPVGKTGGTRDNWQHEAGRKCFERTIDPELYPPIKR